MRTDLTSFLDDCARRGEATAFAYRRGLRVSRWSYARLRRVAYQFARELAGRGILKGERVIFWSENSPEWIAAFFGCCLRGAVAVPLDAQSTPEFVRRVQNQVQARLLLAPHERARRLPDLPRLPLEDLGRTLAHLSGEPGGPRAISEDDLVEIIFTSGTTAEPRGVCLTHRNLLSNLAPLEREIQRYLKWERPFHPIRFLNLLPLSHVFGQFMGIFVPQLLGGEVFLQDSLNPSEIIENVRKQRVSVIAAVPRQLDSLRQKVEREYAGEGGLGEEIASARDWPFLKRWWRFRRVHRLLGWKFWAFVSGGASLRPETEEFWQRLGFAVLQGYGMTETSALISVNHPFKASRGSVGKSMPGQEMKIDESGEIMVRGRNVSQGYWNGGVEPSADEEGWLRTGDLGEVDAEGNLYFKGRKKDVIVTSAGLNIYPEDLEAALRRQPEVRDCTVIGVEGPHGPEPLAVLILRDEGVSAEEVVGRANSVLGEYQEIRRWHVWRGGDFPRTPTEKVRKRDVLSALESPEAGDTLAQSRALSEILARVTGEARATFDPSASLSADLKLDSLGRVELLSAIEDRFRVEIDESAFTSATTLADVERVIAAGAPDGSAPDGGYDYPAWAQRFPVTWIRVLLFYAVLLPLTLVMCRVRRVGRKNLDEVRGPALFISNHVAMVDQSLILSALPGRFRRRLAIAMEGERLRDWRRPARGTRPMTRLRLLAQYGLVVSLMNVFPLPQKSGFRRSFAFAGESADRGYSLLVFPEGSRT
ncbi:MAG TPA: AMP-binding protein, partial [Blastocatellia bacterium]|nr:AMP-binding protein [Blastocatellia bacterium]